MGLVATGIPIFIVGLLLAIPTKPYYGATPENEWAHYIQPYLPAWAIPSPDGDAVRHFYEGLPAGAPVPYGAWLGPLLWWLSLIFAVYFLCFCLVVILRRQWVEHERLAFPITEVPRLLIETSEGSCLPPILRARPSGLSRTPRAPARRPIRSWRDNTPGRGEPRANPVQE